MIKLGICVSQWVASSLLNVQMLFGTQLLEVSNYNFMQIYYWDA